MNYRRTRFLCSLVLLTGLLSLAIVSSGAQIAILRPASPVGFDSSAAASFQQQKMQFSVKGKVYSYDYQFIDNDECLKCHADKVDPKAFAQSAHGPNSCNSCHWEIKRADAHVKEAEAQGANLKPTPVDCARCHDGQTTAFFQSIHFRNGFSCTDCHSGIHTVLPAKVDQKLIYQICTNCHDGSAYAASVHGAAALAGNADVPGCTDCHGVGKSLHDIRAPKGAESKEFHTDACASCHADKRKMERNDVDPLATKTYFEGIHGKIEELGYPNLVAGCSDCHGAHNVLPTKDAKSTLSKNNLIKTCGKCHRDANPRFVQYIPHLNYQSPRRPVFFWAYMFMHGLLFSVFGFFWVHTFLFWRKDFWMSWRIKAKGPGIPETRGLAFRRFSPIDRILHFMLLISFMGLVLSGLPLAFPGAPWAARMMRLFGGFPTRGIIHRVFACIMITAFTAAMVYIIYFLFFKKIEGRPGFFKRLFGPDSLFPRLRDFRDLWNMLKWFVDKGPKPEFDRWTYWEKFDFFAVFWGMLIIGTSGLIRWIPEVFTKLLPGWIVNVAVILHSDEALLAVGFIFTVHFFNNHLRPRNFPLNTVIFSGKLPQYQLIEDHSLHYKRLVESNQLRSHEGKFPGVWADLFSRLLGFAMLGIGALCLILIGWKFIQ
jgi:cytochrome b subunit of formate dehydrogenase